MPRVIRDKRKGFLRLLDLREWADRYFFFLGRWYDLGAQLTLDLILREGDNVVDVGANYGHFSLTAASIVGDTGTVIAFEPNPKAFARLQTHIDMNRISSVRTYNAGLADAPGELTLSVPKKNSGEASFTGTNYADAETVSCPILKGDDEIGEQKIACIKIDVEGFEMRVLRGLLKIIERDRPWIITEIVRSHLSRDGQVPADLDDLLRPCGYTPMRINLAGQKGRNKKLELRAFDPATEEGDVLWVPDDQRNALAGVIVTSV